MRDITLPPPEREPERQYYYMKKLRGLANEKAAAGGRTQSACVVNMGCQMNARDSEKLSGILSACGWELSEDEDADIVIFNTCTVRENANNKLYGRLGTIGGMKKKNPEKFIALCGCMMQEPHVVEKLKESFRFVNLVFGTHNIYKFAELLYEALTAPDKMLVDVWEKSDKIVEKLPGKRKFSFKSGVNITFGCDNFCTYCIVPYVRGRERSREAKDILEEIEALAGDGVKEIMLLGQNVNSYGKGLEDPISFAELLRRADEIEGIERIRFMTSHPKDLSEELIDVMANGKHICRHMHLPLQSGSDRMLAAMNRHYTKERYLYLAGELRKRIPDIAITTDIIVGFPGETEEDFLDTMDVVEKVRFDSAFTFIYSPRVGTPAAKLPQNSSEAEIKDRFDRLLKRVQEIAGERAAMLTGKREGVLVEHINTQDASLVTGRLSNNSIVHFPGDASMIGKVVEVVLTECKGFYYLGNVYDS